MACSLKTDGDGNLAIRWQNFETDKDRVQGNAAGNQGDRGEGHRGPDGGVQRPHGGRACNDGHTKCRSSICQGVCVCVSVSVCVCLCVCVCVSVCFCVFSIVPVFSRVDSVINIFVFEKVTMHYWFKNYF